MAQEGALVLILNTKFYSSLDANIIVFSPVHIHRLLAEINI